MDPKTQMLLDWDPKAASYCKWANVICDSAGNVIKLTLSYLGLDGAMPPAEAVMDLPLLSGLLLGGNMFRGTLPAGYSAAAQLQELYVNDNQLSGTLPKEWSKMENIKELSLSFNMITGTLPPEWGALQKLRVLKVNSNQLKGSVPAAWAPPSTPNMVSLKTLTIFNNPELSGCLPKALAGKGPSGWGFFQGPSGQLTKNATTAATGTKIKRYC